MQAGPPPRASAEALQGFLALLKDAKPEAIPETLLKDARKSSQRLNQALARLQELNRRPR